MSTVKPKSTKPKVAKPKTVKAVKAEVECVINTDSGCNQAMDVPVKPKATRKKKQPPTKAEKLQMISEELVGLEKELNLFKEERPRLKGMNVPNIEELIDDEITELEEEKKELLEVQKETLALPEDPVIVA